MVSLKFKKATTQDLPTIYRLAEEIWLPTFAPLFSEIELRSLYEGMYNDSLLTDWLSKEENEFYFVLVNEELKGYYATEDHDTYSKLDKLYVHPELQGQGIGKRVLDKIVSDCKEKRFDNLELRVNRGNNGAIRFYEKNEFTIRKSIDFEGPNGFLYEDYIMVKSIQ